MRKFGSELRKLRKEKGLRVYQLADKLKISAVLMTQIEKGYRNPSKRVLSELGRRFGKKLVFLYTDELYKETIKRLKKQIQAIEKVRLKFRGKYKNFIKAEGGILIPMPPIK